MYTRYHKCIIAIVLLGLVVQSCNINDLVDSRLEMVEKRPSNPVQDEESTKRQRLPATTFTASPNRPSTTPRKSTSSSLTKAHKSAKKSAKKSKAKHTSRSSTNLPKLLKDVEYLSAMLARPKSSEESEAREKKQKRQQYEKRIQIIKNLSAINNEAHIETVLASPHFAEVIPEVIKCSPKFLAAVVTFYRRSAEHLPDIAIPQAIEVLERTQKMLVPQERAHDSARRAHYEIAREFDLDKRLEDFRVLEQARQQAKTALQHPADNSKSASLSVGHSSASAKAARPQSSAPLAQHCAKSSEFAEEYDSDDDEVDEISEVDEEEWKRISGSLGDTIS